MNREDYFKYYIQGSDHYLIPKDVFIELFDEMVNWREEVKELNQKYLNAVADYKTTMFEKEQLNSLVNSCQEEIRRLKKQLEVGEEQYNDLVEEKESLQEQLSSNTLQLEELKEQVSKGLYNTCLPYSTGYNKAIKDKETQQKEFIEYMNKTIEELECDDVDDEEMKGYLIQRIDTFKEILSKFKKIIDSDINVGSKGDKE